MLLSTSSRGRCQSPQIGPKIKVALTNVTGIADVVSGQVPARP
jgi:hypothetical protein